MVDILHRIGIAAVPCEVYAALTDRGRMASWWTREINGEPDVGSNQPIAATIMLCCANSGAPIS